MTKSLYLLTVSFAILLVTVVGCNRAEPPKPVVDASLPPVDDQNDATNGMKAVSITDEEAEAFAELLVQSVAENDAATYVRLIGAKDIITRALEPVSGPQKKKDELIAGADAVGTQLLKTLHSQVTGGGSYRFVRVVRRNGEAHVVFRLLPAAGGVNYHDFRLTRTNGELHANQFFVALVGEALADTLRKTLGPALAQQTAVGRLTGQAKKSMDDLICQGKVSKAVQEGNKAEALRLISTLSTEAQASKPIMLMKIMCLDLDETETYVAAVEEYVKRFPDDVSIGLITLDSAVLRKDTKGIMRSHRGLQAWTGGDPAVDLMIGCALANCGETEKAVELTKDVDPNAVATQDAHDHKLTIALYNKDHDEVLKQLRIMRDVYGFQFGDLSQVEAFQDFAASPQHDEWLH